MSTENNTRPGTQGLSRLNPWMLVLPFLAAVLVLVAWSGRPVAPSSGGQLVFEDLFDRDEVGDGYRVAAADQGLGGEGDAAVAKVYAYNSDIKLPKLG